MMTRRSLFLAGGAVALAHGRTSQRPVFDAHLHCPPAAGENMQWHNVTHDFQGFMQYLESCGVRRGIMGSGRALLEKEPAGFIAGNREVARFSEQTKGRFKAACVVNPLYPEEAARELEDCRKQLGMVWVGELCNYITGYDYKDPKFTALVEHIVKLGMILQIHTEGDEMKYVMDQFPQATMVFAHFGDDHEFENIFKRIDLVAAHPNCYLDTSGRGQDRVGLLEYAVEKIGPDRVLFGSDFSINDPSAVIARVDHAILTREQKEKILWRNAEALLAKVKA